MKNRLLFGYIFSFLIVFSFSQFALAAAFPGYQPLATLPNVQTNDKGEVPTDGGFAPYLNNLYTMGVAAAAGLAVIMVIWGGVEYITAVAGEGKSGGKERITSAILGLLLALGSYIILNTINPDLLKLSFNLKPADIKIDASATTDIAPENTMDINSTPVNTGYVVGDDGTITQSSTYTGNPADVNQDAITAATRAFDQYGSSASNQRYIGVMDYSQPSSAARFYIIDRETGQITSTQASHGVGSDPNNTGYATQFSNSAGSNASALGAFIATPYHSPSMNKDVLLLNGQQPGLNGNSADRGLEIHSSNYVNQTQCGRSNGCMAVSPGAYSQIQSQLSGALIYGYHP